APEKANPHCPSRANQTWQPRLAWSRSGRIKFAPSELGCPHNRRLAPRRETRKGCNDPGCLQVEADEQSACLKADAALWQPARVTRSTPTTSVAAGTVAAL